MKRLISKENKQSGLKTTSWTVIYQQPSYHNVVNLKLFWIFIINFSPFSWFLVTNFWAYCRYHFVIQITTVNGEILRQTECLEKIFEPSFFANRLKHHRLPSPISFYSALSWQSNLVFSIKVFESNQTAISKTIVSNWWVLERYTN